MSPSDHTLRAGRVQLLDVTAGIVEELLDVALADAAPDDVTPPLGETDGWNPERIGWFREYHRAAAAGLDGPAAQKTWAVSCDGHIAGSIRLRRPGAAPSEGGPLETGLWLGRSFRGRGIGREALTLARPWHHAPARPCCRPKQPPKMRPPRRCCAQLVPNWPQTA